MSIHSSASASPRGSAAAEQVVVEFFGTTRMIIGRDQLETPPGTLGDILARLDPKLNLRDSEGITSHVRISLNGRQFISDLQMPILAGAHLIILEAAAGG
ncbi:MAG: MoaD/ThiS family protein [bacterium]|nr:MoaD/ThiS family protein [bacterium]